MYIFIRINQLLKLIKNITVFYKKHFAISKINTNFAPSFRTTIM